MIEALAHAALEHGQVLHVLARAAVLADNSDNTDGGESHKSGPLGLVVILALCVACYFLFKSMSKHLRRVREGSLGTTPEQSDGHPPAAAGPTAPVDLHREEPAPPL